MITLEDADKALKSIYLMAVKEQLNIQSNNLSSEIENTRIDDDTEAEVNDCKRKEDLCQKCYNSEEQESRRRSMNSRKNNWNK